MNKPTFKDIYFLCIQKLTNFPYIEQDFDALTNYELLCKIVEYLTKVISNENTQNESIIALYEAFNNLKNYVDNYFDNLDVQDEINNKLDEMLEDGALEQIIEQFLQSTALWCFDSVEDMKNATNLINGSYAKTLGYYGPNDGGGATYKIRTITNEDIVDNAIIIPVLNTELNNANNSTILNTFITNHSNYNLYFPKDYYYFTEPITMSRGITIFGDFESNYGLSSTYQTASLHFAKSGFINCDKNSFRNLSIYGSSRSESNFYCGFKRKSPEGNACSIENCNISNFHAGVHGDTKAVLVSNSIISDCDIGILDFTDGRVINNTITRCYDGIRNTDNKKH